jgi:hypothetical protein
LTLRRLARHFAKKSAVAGDERSQLVVGVSSEMDGGQEEYPDEPPSKYSIRPANGHAEEKVVRNARRYRKAGESDGAARSRLECYQRVGSSC